MPSDLGLVQNSPGGILSGNVAAEPFWVTLKKEFVYLHPFDTLARLRAGVFEYIEVHYYLPGGVRPPGQRALSGDAASRLCS